MLLHELGGSSESWREVIPRLASDRPVIAVDFRGAGRSEKPIGSFKLSDLADDIEALLKALGIADRVDVIGAALGSLVGALLAIRHPARLRRLMMCAVAPDMVAHPCVRDRACPDGAGGRHARRRGCKPGEVVSGEPSRAAGRVSCDLSRQRSGCVRRTLASVGAAGDDRVRLGSNPSAHPCRLRRASFSVAA